jgi:hypothetical protein
MNEPREGRRTRELLSALALRVEPERSADESTLADGFRDAKAKLERVKRRLAALRGRDAARHSD